MCVCINVFVCILRLFLERGAGREIERGETSLCVPSHVAPWPATRACALPGNQTGDPRFTARAHCAEPHRPGPDYGSEKVCNLPRFDWGADRTGRLGPSPTSLCQKGLWKRPGCFCGERSALLSLSLCCGT